jgi:hypothetical protein
MKRWKLAILIFELVLFAAILVLPQVALPDFTFHNGSAPVAAHARVCDSVPGAAISVVAHIPAPAPLGWVHAESPNGSTPRAVDSSLSKLCVLIC